MKQRLSPVNTKKGQQKPWTRFCLYAGLGLMLFSALLYAIYYITMDREFYVDQDFFGKETYKELFTLEQEKEPYAHLIRQAEEALAFVGSSEEAQSRFGILSAYCATEEAVAESRGTMKVLNAGVEGDSGFVWIAYTQEHRDAEGNLVQSRGTEQQRILSRWTTEYREGTWVVTEIRENRR